MTHYSKKLRDSSNQKIEQKKKIKHDNQFIDKKKRKKIYSPKIINKKQNLKNLKKLNF